MRCTQASCRAVFPVPDIAGELTLSRTNAISGEAKEVSDVGARRGSTGVAPAPVFDWRTAPPPPAGSEWSPESQTAVETTLPAAPSWESDAQPTSRRGRRWVVLALALFVSGFIAWGGYAVVQSFTQAEARLAATAEQAFSSGEYGKAATAYGDLASRFSRSARSCEYRFRSALAETRRLAGMVPPVPQEALAALERFVAAHGADPQIKEHLVDVFSAATKTAGDFVAEGADTLKTDSAAAALRVQDARRTVALAEKYSPADSDVAKLRRAVEALASSIEREKARSAARIEIVRLLGLARPDLDSARDLIRRAGFSDDAELKVAWTQAEARLRSLVEFRVDPLAAQPGRPILSSGILPAPGGPTSGLKIPVVARGILFAVDARTGRVAWADRVGLGTDHLPVMISADRWLVIADPPTLQLRDSATGEVLWVQSLPAAAVGPPVVTRFGVFIALGGADGEIWQIDPNTGNRTGRFVTGGPHAGGVTLHPGRSWLLVPALAQQIFVLDLQSEDGLPPRCIATIPTEHPAGTVRRPPTVVDLPDGGSGLLLETLGGRGDGIAELYRLPDGATRSAVLQDRVPYPGWSRFGPAVSADRLALAGDGGGLAVWGLRHPGSADSPLYPLLEHPVSGLPPIASFLLWDRDLLIALTDGRLRQWRIVVNRSRGPTLTTGWTMGEPWGDAVQAPLLIDGIVYTATSRADAAQVIVAAVRAETGELLWQRPLGFNWVGLVSQAGRVIAIDPRGAIQQIDPSVSAAGWQFVGRDLASAIGPVGTTTTLSIHAGATHVAHGSGDSVIVRRIASDGAISEQRLTAPAPVGGRVGVSPRAAVVPLSNGQLVRATPDRGKPVAGPTWRKAGANPELPGAVIWWHDDVYLVFDGSRRVTPLRWGDEGDFDLQTAHSHERPRRLIAPPVIIPGESPRAVVADVTGTVALLKGDRLDVERTWRFGGDLPISLPPIEVAGLVCLARGGTELIALRPDAAEPAWRFALADAEWVGAPTAVRDDVIAADSIGRLWAFGPNGSRRVLSLPAGLVAVGTPAGLGPDRVLVPLFDGSAVIVELAQFRNP